MRVNRIKTKLAVLFFLIQGISFAENVVEFNLDTGTLRATEKLEVTHGDLTLNILGATRDSERNYLYLDKPFTARLMNPNGRGFLSVDRGEVALNGERGLFFDAQGYFEVGEATGAEYPNDKIYFGGNKIQYEDSSIEIRNGWITTDYKVREAKDPKEAGYHLKSDNIKIEMDKQITLEGIDLYRGSRNTLPFSFPWFRANIREGSQVPLFPYYSSGDKDYGFSTSWGFLWGDRDDKYRGGFAPKISDKTGLMIGRMENWYETDKYGTIKLNTTDTLVLKKNNDVDRRFTNELSHVYSGEYGRFSGNIISTTNNQIKDLNNRIEDFNNLNSWERLGMKKNLVAKTDRTEFITINTELKGMGERKDISFSGKIKQVTDKDAYDIMLFDELDEGRAVGNFRIGTDRKEITASEKYSKSALFTDLALYKNNKDYKIGGYYRNINDLAPGRNINSDLSREESFGYEIVDKKNQLSLKYDNITRDKYRPLSFMERNSDLNATFFTRRGNSLGSNLTAQHGNYSIAAIPEYNKYDSENLNIKIGEYKLNNFNFESGYELAKSEKELSQLKDPTRDKVSGNVRDREYNRYNDITYDDRELNRAYGIFSNDGYKLTLGGGEEKQEIYNREGLYNYSLKDLIEGEAYKRYTYTGEFADYKLEKTPFKIGEFGKVGFYLGGRYTEYTNQYVTGYNGNELTNNSHRTNAGFTHEKEFLKGGDRGFENKFKYTYQDYNKTNALLTNEENFHKFENKINFDVNEIQGNYGVTYSIIDSAGTGDRKNEILKNRFNLNLSKNEDIRLTYNLNKRFTNENIQNRNENDLTYESYGFRYRKKNHTFTYNRDDIDYDILNKKDKTDNSKEKIDIDTFGYTYTLNNLNRVSLRYIIGNNERDNLTLGKKDIDTKKQSYSLSFYDYGDRFDNTYTVGYGKNRYLSRGRDTLSSDTYRFSYVFVDKSMDPEFLKTYARRELDRDDITQEDLDRVSLLIRERKEQEKEGVSSLFNLSRSNRPIAFTGEHNRKFSISSYAERSKERYEKTGDFFDSLERVGGNIGYSQRRLGVGLGYSKEIKDELNWSEEDETYSFMLNYKIGKPSESYRITTYGKLEKKWYDTEKDLGKTMGIELGKEMGYYEWSIGYYTDFDYDKRKNDWRVGVQFTLLTFPDKPIFGIGARKSGDSGNPSLKTSVLSKFK